MLILQTIRASTAADHSVRQGTWRGDLRVTPNTRGLIMGIIGMGTIGKVGCSLRSPSTALIEGASLCLKRFKVEFSSLFMAFTTPNALTALGMKVIYNNRRPLPREGLSQTFHPPVLTL